MSDQYEQYFASFEREGETQIRIRLAAGEFGVRDGLFGGALEWLRLKDEARFQERAERASSVAREANSIARSALRMSKIAMILSAIATLITAIIPVIIQWISQTLIIPL